MPDPLNEEAVKKIVADAVKPLADAVAPMVKTIETLSANQKVIVGTMAADKTAAEKAKAAAEAAAKAKAEADGETAGGKTAEAPKPLTLEDVAKTVSDMLAKRDADAKSSAARDAFIADKLKGVPAAYQAKLGSDPAKWPAEEQAIREQLKADLASLGATVKDVSGAAAGATGSSATAATETERLTKLKASGLSDGEAAFADAMKLPA